MSFCGFCGAEWSAGCECRHIAARVAKAPTHAYGSSLERFAVLLRMYAPRGGAQVLTVQQCAELATGRAEIGDA